MEEGSLVEGVAMEGGNPSPQGRQCLSPKNNAPPLGHASVSQMSPALSGKCSALAEQ